MIVNGKIYPDGCIRLELLVDPDHQDIHAVGGDKTEDEKDDFSYEGFKYIMGPIEELNKITSYILENHDSEIGCDDTISDVVVKLLKRLKKDYISTRVPN
jgi:hypothetical protein